MSVETRHNLLELARFLTELSVVDYYFVIHRPSTIALAAVLNAMDELPGCCMYSWDCLLAQLGKVTRLQDSSDELVACRERLRLLYIQGGYSHPSAPTDARPETVSPVCVSYGFDRYSATEAAIDQQQVKAADYAPSNLETSVQD
jgi:hypothetical protein